MATISELIGIYIRGFKRLFFYKPIKKGEKGKLSLFKIMILGAYILAFMFAFLQFSEANVSETAISEFRNSGQYIQINNNLGIKDNWTISSWIMIDARGNGVFFSIPNSSDTPGVEFSINHDFKFQIRTFNTTNDGVVLIGLNKVQKNFWYCVTGTYDGNQVRLFVNGIEEGSMHITGAIRTYYNKTFIGAFSEFCRTGQNATRGRIIEVRVLDYAQNAIEITSDYNGCRISGEFPERSSTVAWYHLNDVIPFNGIKDSSPNGFDGIVGIAISTIEMQNNTDIWEETLYFEPYDTDNFFPFSIYGQIAILINFIIIIAAIFFLVIGDEPLTIERLRNFEPNIYITKIVTFRPHSRSHFITLISVFFLMLFVIERIISGEFEQFGVVLSIVFSIYWIGKLFAFFIWPIVSPVLVISTLIISLDLFGKDNPKVMNGFTKRLIALFIVSLFLVFALLSVISIFIPIEEGQPTIYANPIIVKGLDGLYLYEIALWWTNLGIILICMTILTLILLEIYIMFRYGSNELRRKRRSNLLFVFPLTVIFLISKTFPFIITFGPRLRTLDSALDLISLIFVIFFGIFRVLGLEEEKKELETKKFVITPYSKALFIFFLAFASFYISLEANLILTLFGIQNIARFERMLFSVLSIPFTLFYLFKRYQPFRSQ